MDDKRTDVGDQFGIRQPRSSPRSWRWAVTHRRQVWPCDANRFSYRGHRPSIGNEVERNSSFFGPAARDTASGSASLHLRPDMAAANIIH